MTMEENTSKFSIDTPEQVEFEYELAGLGSRLLAFLFDLLIRILVSFVLFVILLVILIILTPAFFTKTANDAHFSLWALAIFVIVLFLINTAYFIFFETIWNGQTPGKKLLGLRVIREGGYPIGFYEAAVRNIFRIVDMMPGTYLVGGLCVFFSPKEKRLGDYAAGTIVIKEKESKLSFLPVNIYKTMPKLQEIANRLSKVSRDEYNIVVEFLERKSAMDISYRKQMGDNLASSVSKKLEFIVPENTSPEDFLMEFVALYRKEMKFF